MRKLCWFALPFCAAAFAACLGLPFPLFIGLAFAALGLLAGCLKRLPVCLACLGIAVGLLWFQGYTSLFRAPALELAGQTADFSATVTSFPRETSIGGYRVEAQLHLPGPAEPKIILFADPSGKDLLPGDHISGTARFRSADLIRGETVIYYEAKGIYLQGSVVGTLTAKHPKRTPLLVRPVYIAQAIKDSVQTIFPADVSALMTALLTGDKTNLSDTTYTALQRSGTAHIVAVSGLHLSFFAGFLALFFRKRSKLGAVLTIFLVLLFTAVAGFTPSVVRAAVMIIMTMLAPLLGRESDPPTTLSVALFLLVACNPYSIQSVSLQLSFAAVTGIHWVSGPLYRAMTRSLGVGGNFGRRLWRRFCRVLTANASLTIGALLLTTPLTAWYFGTVSLISPVTNLLVLWAVSLAFAPGLILTLLGIALPGLSALLTVPITLLSRYVLWGTRTLGSLSFSSLSMNSIYLCGWLVLVYVIILIVLLRNYHRPILPICSAIIALCTALVLSRASLLSPPLSITMLDVGQGQSILLCSGGRTALIDCGGNKDNAGDIAADYLQSLGISRLDLLVLTHCHSDHANGVSELFARMDISSLILPDLPDDQSPYRAEILSLAQEAGTSVILLDSNRTLSFGKSELNLYASLGGGATNEEGLFVMTTCDDFDVLITGDANSFVESLLIKYASIPDIEVLAAGHHGSRSSTSEHLLDTLKPETCLISVGYNTYGHPADETLLRLAQRDIDIYRTDRMGHLTVRYEGE